MDHPGLSVSWVMRAVTFWLPGFDRGRAGPRDRRLPIILRAILRLAGNDTIAVGTRL
ncbi:hypothetical protein [Streptomyces violarus]|uniref:hypothetical protein n=1 Tax=Streptomyces violarus TaxID=67380 RepID=UPI0021BE8199|nr:hypothetical protein [Streptomyces violarus]MCT9142148.1 hypothetical protein [Streptomyces violarus]